MASPVRQDEQAVKARERALAKGRRTRAKNAARAARERERRKGQYRVWLKRERQAYEAYVVGGRTPALLATWRKVLREEPTYDGAVEVPDE